MNKLNKWVRSHRFLSLTLAGIPIILCICCVAVIFIPMPQSVKESISQANLPTSTIDNFDSSEPVMNVISTPTLEPTSTTRPTSTNTPIPSAPSCSQIKNETENMTDVQWDKYKNDFSGLWIESWEGKVTEVSKEFLGSNYNVHVKTKDGCTILVEVMDEETALTYSRDDSVIVSGRTSGLADIFGKVIYLDDDMSSIAKK
jgi:hypothetical protein